MQLYNFLNVILAIYITQNMLKMKNQGYFSILGCSQQNHQLAQFGEGLNMSNPVSKVFPHFFTLIITNHATVEPDLS